MLPHTQIIFISSILMGQAKTVHIIPQLHQVLLAHPLNSTQVNYKAKRDTPKQMVNKQTNKTIKINDIKTQKTVQ